MKNQQGFSLIELLIVMLVIGIIAVIAIPNLLLARRASNEAATISNLRTIVLAEVSYQHSAGVGDFGSIAQLFAGNYVDSTINSATTGTPKSGYFFSSIAVPATSGNFSLFTIGAIPSSLGGTTATGSRRFCVVEDGVLRESTTSLGIAPIRTDCLDTAIFFALTR